jgi:hypothetical protein
MAKSISVRQQRRGRPATGRMPTTTLRLPEVLSAQIDAWARKQADGPGHSEAIRRLIEMALKTKSPVKPVRSTPNRVRAAELAAKTIEKIIDPAAPPEERAQRRRRLTKGPPEFREDRVDLPKTKGR